MDNSVDMVNRIAALKTAHDRYRRTIESVLNDVEAKLNEVKAKHISSHVCSTINTIYDRTFTNTYMYVYIFPGGGIMYRCNPRCHQQKINR